MRMAPPGFTSNSHTGFVNPWGPHHSATRFGSVHALNTSSRGASNTRVRTNSCSSLAITFPADMLFLLFLYFAQIVIQPIEALRPELPVVPDPIGNVLERRGRDPAGPPLRLAAASNQTGVFQHCKVAGNGGHTHGKGRCQLCHRSLAGGQAGKDGTAGGVGERGEGGAQMVRPRRH